MRGSVAEVVALSVRENRAHLVCCPAGRTDHTRGASPIIRSSGSRSFQGAPGSTADSGDSELRAHCLTADLSASAEELFWAMHGIAPSITTASVMTVRRDRIVNIGFTRFLVEARVCIKFDGATYSCGGSRSVRCC